MKLDKFIDEKNRRRIVAAIEAAEMDTSGEIRVHLEKKCPVDDPCERAVEVFYSLKMDETAEHNGVLIYIAYESRHFAIIGDKAIDTKVPAGFWDEEKRVLGDWLKKGEAAEGVCAVIKMIGEHLSAYFPHQSDDVNELTNEISYGKE